MFNTKFIIKISQRDIKGKLKNEYKNIESIRVKHKKIYIKIEEEEIHIRLLKIPKVHKSNIRKVLENQLVFMYGKDSKDIVYGYDIWKEEKTSIEVIIYCARSCKLNSIKNIIDNNKLKNIEFIQFPMLNNIKDKINHKEYIIIAKNKNWLYFMGVANKKLISNRIVECNCSRESLIGAFDYTINKMRTFNVFSKVVYGINFNKVSFIEHIKQNMYQYNNIQNESKKMIKVKEY